MFEDLGKFPSPILEDGESTFFFETDIRDVFSGEYVDRLYDMAEEFNRKKKYLISG